jgi:hypothetical protein
MQPVPWVPAAGPDQTMSRWAGYMVDKMNDKMERAKIERLA